jgi:hypothetical protein
MNEEYIKETQDRAARVIGTRLNKLERHFLDSLIDETYRRGYRDCAETMTLITMQENGEAKAA